MMGQVESNCKIVENPYGYQAKEINAPAKGNAITFCGIYVDSLPTDTNAKNTLIARYKDKDTQLDVRSEGICLFIEQSLLQQYEDAWIFKPEIIQNQGVVLQIADFDENEFGGVFDSNFLYRVKVDNTTRYMILNYIKSETAQVPDDILTSVGKWIGCVSIATMPCNSGRNAKLNNISQLANAITKEFSNPNLKGLKKEHKYFADARWGSLKKFQSHKGFDPIKATDPLGNTVAHLAVFNQFLDVFTTIAKAHPKLLTVQNIFGNTPLHNIGLLHSRQKEAKYFDWKLFWELPWDYSIKNKKGQTGIEKLCELPAKELVIAFKALLANTNAWQSVIKCHDVPRLLSAAVVGYLSNQLQHANDDEESVNVVKYFVEKGADDKALMFNAALKFCRVLAAKHLLDLGTNITFEDVATAVNTQNRPTVDVVINTFDFGLATPDQVNSLCQTVALAGWTDIMYLLAKRGGKFPLQLNNSDDAPIVIANTIAQMNSSAVLPLKYACVDAIDSSLKSEELAKKLALLPEEVRILFPAKDLWRWTLFLNDEAKRNRFLQLYGAINSALTSEDGKTMKITIGDVEFSVKCVLGEGGPFCTTKKRPLVGLEIWTGESLHYRIIVEFSLNARRKGQGMTKKEENIQILDQILESLGWPLEDTFVFLMICYYAYSSNTEDCKGKQISRITAKDFFFPLIIDAHVIPPTWYIQFVNNCYGIEESVIAMRTREKKRAKVLDEEDSM